MAGNWTDGPRRRLSTIGALNLAGTVLFLFAVLWFVLLATGIWGFGVAGGVFMTCAIVIWIVAAVRWARERRASGGE